MFTQRLIAARRDALYFYALPREMSLNPLKRLSNRRVNNDFNPVEEYLTQFGQSKNAFDFNSLRGKRLSFSNENVCKDRLYVAIQDKMFYFTFQTTSGWK